MKDVVNTNYFGPRRVNEFFGPFLSSVTTTSRIVNVSSAAASGYIANLSQSHPHRRALGSPWTMDHGIAALDQMALDMIRTKPSAEGYGFSKALLNAYTWILAKQYDNAAAASSTHRVLVNAVSPGFIDTDITAQMSGGKKPPAAGAVPPCFLLMDDATIPIVPTGRYYGSDCIRSPLSYYRDPGEPPYEAHDDIVDLLPGATAALPSMASVTTE
jgi:carbonyl reductase 1